MQDSTKGKKIVTDTSENAPGLVKKDYQFGGIEEFSLEKIEESILEESIYLDVFAGSDIAFKENIRPLTDVLPAIEKLNCISYDYKTSEFLGKNFPENRQIGVIAQEIQSFFPELVRNDKDGDLQVNYSQISTLALQAIKELKIQLDASNAKIAELEKKLNRN